jgi:hypothetical protein
MGNPMEAADHGPKGIDDAIATCVQGAKDPTMSVVRVAPFIDAAYLFRALQNLILPFSRQGLQPLMEEDEFQQGVMIETGPATTVLTAIAVKSVCLGVVLVGGFHFLKQHPSGTQSLVDSGGRD